MRPLLADPSLRPNAGVIAATSAHFRAVLSVRRSTPLLRLRTAADIHARLRFFNRPIPPGSPAGSDSGSDSGSDAGSGTGSGTGGGFATVRGVLVWRVMDGDGEGGGSALAKLDTQFRCGGGQKGRQAHFRSRGPTIHTALSLSALFPPLRYLLRDPQLLHCAAALLRLRGEAGTRCCIHFSCPCGAHCAHHTRPLTASLRSFSPFAFLTHSDVPSTLP